MEFKSTLRWSLKENKQDDKGVTHAVLKTIAAFLNTEGASFCSASPTMARLSASNAISLRTTTLRRAVERHRRSAQLRNACRRYIVASCI